MRSVLKFLGIIVCGWLLTGASAEVAFRLLGDQPSVDLARLYSPFGQGNYKLASNVDTSANFAAGKLSVHTDELGLRCDQLRQFATRGGDHLDVLLMGDSQGFGNGVGFEDSLAGALAVNAIQDACRVANTSVGGHSAASQLQLVKWLRERHAVRASNYVLLVTPAIAQSGEHLNRATVGSDGRLYGGEVGPTAALRLWSKTHLASYARIRDAARNAGVGVTTAEDAPFIFGFYDRAAEERLRQSFSRFLRELKQFAAAQQARVHLVYIPLTLEADFEPIRAAAAVRGITLDRDVPLRVCKAAAQELGLPVHNLRPVLESLHDRGEPLHLKGDFHYNPGLSRACGAQIWNALRPALLKEHIVSSKR